MSDGSHAARTDDSGGLDRRLEEIWTSYGDALYGYALSLVRNRADTEDVLQCAFLRIAKALGDGRKIDNEKAYFYRVTRNEALRLMSDRAGDPVPSQHLERVMVSSPAGDFEAELDVSMALAGLPDEQREVIVLKLFQGLTFREICELTGVSLQTAASRFRYALEKLRRSRAAQPEPSLRRARSVEPGRSGGQGVVLHAGKR